MPRPIKCRRIESVPGITYFKPAGIPLRMLEEIQLSLEEMEAVRLKDIEDLDQEQSAQKMNISRPTFQRVLESARKKIADALLNGKAIRINGGNFEVTLPDRCLSGTDNICRCKIQGGTPFMKIAVISNDEKTISQHFGMAPLYVVFTVEDGKITGKETRPKMGHQHFAEGEGHQHHGGQHGHDADAHAKHGMMAQPLSDCQVLIAGGMGWGAYNSMKTFNIEPIITEISDIEQAVKLYVEGKLVNRMEKLH
jgi:predicted DNA-binding protein (UPF0251 family)/predicted Fe-Mo cluster-binding NifX family protein